MVEISPEVRYLRANAAFYRMFGYSPEELSDLTVADVPFPEDRERVLAQADSEAPRANPGKLRSSCSVGSLSLSCVSVPPIAVA